eukprot:39405-Amphidinium_carterae.2
MASCLAPASVVNNYLEKWMESFPSLPLVKANRCGACVVKAHKGPPPGWPTIESCRGNLKSWGNWRSERRRSFCRQHCRGNLPSCNCWDTLRTASASLSTLSPWAPFVCVHHGRGRYHDGAIWHLHRSVMAGLGKTDPKEVTVEMAENWFRTFTQEKAMYQ